MDERKIGGSLDSLISAFSARIAELQELVIARNIYPASSVADLSAVDTSLTAMEQQVHSIKDRLREETLAIPKAKKLVDASLKQQKELQSMLAYVPSQYPERLSAVSLDNNEGLHGETSKQENFDGSLKLVEESAAPAPPKEKKGRLSPPLWFITEEELDSLSGYMKGRLTLEKVNAATTDMAAYAEANSQLIAAPKKKLKENLWEKALELRDIAMTESVKGKHFFLEMDIKGPSLKLDHTGKAILTVLRHLGRISETRIGHNRVFILLKPQ